MEEKHIYTEIDINNFNNFKLAFFVYQCVSTFSAFIRETQSHTHTYTQITVDFFSVALFSLAAPANE